MYTVRQKKKLNLNRKFNEISKCIVTYVLHWTVRDEEPHARVSKLGLELFSCPISFSAYQGTA
jgi:hypothetical protein